MTQVEPWNGPGTYGDVVEELSKRLEARGIVLLVRSGNRGEGFEVVFEDPAELLAVPRVLREIADLVEADLRKASS